VGFYADRILPRLIDMAMRQETLLPYRRRLVPMARGRVLEIGVGSGANLPLYAAGVHVVGLEPSPRLLSMARAAARNAGLSVDLIEGSAEALPLDERSIDTVVTTWTLCSIPDVGAALREVRRVLKPSGQWLFVEHGLSPDETVRRWQHWLTPLNRRIAGGCHLDRPIRTLIEDAGFGIEHLDQGYMKGPRPMTFLYEGVARPG
jgi:ubiquinone/menaquinone biosynthesis C-methylase UbiE